MKAFGVRQIINLFQNGSFIKRHMSDDRLLHIEDLKYSQNGEGLPELWTEDVYHKTDCEWYH